jgi:hypothetical protein
MDRRSFLATAAAVGLTSNALAQQPSTGDASLKETLTFGLRPRQPADNAFIDVVIARVENKTLPLELVMAVYRWSLDKRPYPYPFFERALRVRARAIGVSI